MIYKRVILKRGKEESVKRFHPWIFSGAIARADKMEEGDLVTVYTHDGALLGNGHFQIGSIAVRLLTFDDTEIDEQFYVKRLTAAYGLRKALGLMRDDNNAFRLVHGEGDFLPGLVIDIYGHTAVMQAHSPGMHFARNIIAQALTELPGDLVHNVYYKSETTLPYKAQLDPQNDYIVGSYDTDVAIENGLKFHVDWLKGQKTGFFVDQRENRRLLEHYAAGRRVLNMFCYTGGFSFYALRGGATLVHSVDSSAKAISLTNANVALNFPDCDRHKAVAEDAFKYLDEMHKGDYDLIVLDPPAFAKHKSALRNALIGYRKLNAKALEKIETGGILFTFSCSQAVNKEQFRLAVFSAAAQTRRKVRILHQLTQPADHPISIYHPEGEYLKGLVLYVE
ncbi:MAG: class I SAM-dependent rRNA methyltransferase [Bacteroidales bacterium]|jgi:23S rRNA (cytosine1962-C5)-methyltransferase|uniref:class I SAM-dependent rRNA methyltransferase n=1 Tax=Sodaliphilus pleomorphus TaxID=2606626 RepID=UPI0023F229E9|nr:class I SAM-dependent rRNA methyltransferase [Sodaliphilus pleomorphus]MDD6687957.1 class I SAM-dependent rRNA methyltransferase [Sodaliphilus pleomorphus]MDD7065376.1 class I SAM-dependent rRNA methyltransferase [Sodaliphilus pleomorphus]MDY6252707.1 class I SAM-dependent rRNA methyltransferase [Bacteroidales bacterium]MDY6260139.1 class I SAM-dependent rRNA methyltransferase [Bacteroidales bacterium]